LVFLDVEQLGVVMPSSFGFKKWYTWTRKGSNTLWPYSPTICNVLSLPTY
jgi:hypothetical protein